MRVLTPFEDATLQVSTEEESSLCESIPYAHTLVSDSNHNVTTPPLAIRFPPFFHVKNLQL